MPTVPGIVWWILGLWFGLALLLGAAASRWFRYLRDVQEGDVYSSRDKITRDHSGVPISSPRPGNNGARD